MKQFGILVVGLMTAATSAHAAPYTGTSTLCTSVSTPTTCKINLVDFMRSKFTFSNGVGTYTSNSTNLSAAENTGLSSSLRYIKAAGAITYDYATDSFSTATEDITVKQGFMSHPTIPNVLLHSKAGENQKEGGTLEIFRFAGGNDNAVYVTAEPNWQFSGYHSYAVKDAAPNIHWRNRGAYWFDNAFSVTRSGTSNVWVSAVRTINLGEYDTIGANSGKFGNTAERAPGYKSSMYVQYFPAESGSWINQGGGGLPTPLEVVSLHQRLLDPNGQIVAWERFDYARHRRSDGTYNDFGMIRFQSSLDYTGTTPPLKCVNGLPPASKPRAICVDGGLILMQDTHYNAFYNGSDPRQRGTVKQWYDAALAYLGNFKNDPKFTVRSTAEDKTLPHNRGGFLPPGSGQDAKGVSFNSSQMLYLENTTIDHDWYVYPNGKDPLFAPSASPTNYCREGYRFLGSLPVTQSYNGLTGTVENTGSLHWVVLCGTGPDALLQASNAGEPSCPASHVTRGWFAKSSSLSTTTCSPTTGACADQTGKAYVNFCVSANQTPQVFPAPYR